MGNKIYDGIRSTHESYGYQDENYWIWGSSVIRTNDGEYHMYVSRWSREYPFFTTWITDSEIAHCVADNPLGPFVFQDVALGKRGAQYWDGQSCHNPKIIQYRDKFLLFYMGSTHPFEPFPQGTDPMIQGKHCIVARSNKRIGMAMADSPNGPWQRLNNPILPTKPNTYYSFLTSNPSPVIHEDGSVKLMFKARAYEKSKEHPGDTHGRMTIGMASAENFMGPYKVISANPLFGPDHFGEIEDPSMWHDRDGYHMIAKDMGQSIAGEKHAGILAHSKNGLDWKLDEHPLAYSKTISYEDGTEKFLGQMERPFVLLENGKITTLYFAVMDGPGGFNNGTMSRNIAIPVEI